MGLAGLAKREVRLSFGGREDRLAVLALLSLVLFLFRGAVFGGRVFYWRDVSLIWYPQIASFVRCFALGAWPLWDPYRGFGQPLLADPQAHVLYPFGWLRLLVSTHAYVTAFVLAHFFLAALGVYVFSRRLGVSAAGALAAGAIWILCGPFLSLHTLWHHLAGAAWIPWVFVSGDLALRRGRLGDHLLFSAAVALLLLGGSADMALLCGAGLAAYWLALVAWTPASERVSLWRRTGRLVASGVLGIAVGCGVWIPAAEQAQGAARWDLPASSREVWSLHPLGLIETLWWFRWSETAAISWDATLGKDLQATFLPSVYLGMPALALVLAGAASRRKPARLFLALGVLSLLVALGRYGGVYVWLSELVPVVRMLRFPVKALVLASFCTALLAGLGFDAWSGRGGAGRWAWRLMVATPVALFVAISALALLWSQRAPPGAPSLSESLRSAAAEGFPLWLALATGLGVLALALLARRSPGPRWAALVGLVAVVDLVAAQHDQVRLASPELYRIRPRALEWVDAKQLDRVYVDDYSVVRGRAPVPGAQPFYRVARVPVGWSSREALALGAQLYLNPPTPARWGVFGSFDHDLLGLQPRPQVELTEYLRGEAPGREQLRLLRLGAVDFALGLYPAPWWSSLEPVAAYEEVFDAPIRVFRVPQPQPRTYVVEGIRIADGEAALAALVDPAFDPRRAVVLPEGHAREPASGAIGSSRILSYAPDHVSLGAQLERPGLVVLADAYGPGWKATLDGRPAPVLRANMAFRAIEAPAGQHRIELVYRPLGALVGLLLAGAGALVWAGLALRVLSADVLGHAPGAS